MKWGSSRSDSKMHESNYFFRLSPWNVAPGWIILCSKLIPLGLSAVQHSASDGEYFCFCALILSIWLVKGKGESGNIPKLFQITPKYPTYPYFVLGKEVKTHRVTMWTRWVWGELQVDSIREFVSCAMGMAVIRVGKKREFSATTGLWGRFVAKVFWLFSLQRPYRHIILSLTIQQPASSKSATPALWWRWLLVKLDGSAAWRMAYPGHKLPLS